MFKHSPKIEFFSTINHLNDIKDCRPRPLAQLMPDWWKNPVEQNRTIKECPAVVHMLRDSYVIPMWCDVEIVVEENQIGWNLSHPDFQFQAHSNDQFLDFAPDNIKKNTVRVLKALCPWQIKTPKGYSVYQSSNFYGFNDNFSIFPGVINTDYHHEINQQILVHGKNKRFMIKRGEPFAVYTPYKREKFKYETRNATQEDIDAAALNSLRTFTKFKRGYVDHLKELENE